MFTIVLLFTTSIFGAPVTFKSMKAVFNVMPKNLSQYIIYYACLNVCGTHAVVLLDLKCVFELLITRTALGTPPLQGHPGHPSPDQPWCQRQSRQGAHGVKHHLCAEATAQNTNTFPFHSHLCFYLKC